MNYAWGFEALVWPFWALGGVAGLFAWRWALSLLAFAIVARLASRMGARAPAVAVTIALAALIVRDRAAIRPESVVAVLIPLELWILEIRRRGGPDRSAWLVAIQCAWANVHLSWPLGILLIAVYQVEDWLVARSAAPASSPRRGSLLLIGMAGLAASLLNPFGWHALAQPFLYLFVQRSSAIYRAIEELRPLAAKDLLRTWAFLFLAGWPLLILARARRHGLDRVEAALCAAFTALSILGIRYLGPYALVAAPFVARDLDEGLRDLPRPAFLRAAAAGPALVLAAIAGIGWFGMVRPTRTGAAPPLGVDVEWSLLPAEATAFMEAHGVRGHGFNSFEAGGWLLHRFWPDSTRLPFIDIHQAGTPEDLDDYAALGRDPAAWRALEARRRFEWALAWSASQANAIDQDSSFVPVFREDAAVLYVRRDGPLAEVAARFGYRALPGGGSGLGRVIEAAAHDPALASRAEAEARRAVREARHHGLALAVLGSLEGARGDTAASRRDLEEAVRIRPALRPAR